MRLRTRGVGQALKFLHRSSTKKIRNRILHKKKHPGENIFEHKSKPRRGVWHSVGGGDICARRAAQTARPPLRRRIPDPTPAELLA